MTISERFISSKVTGDALFTPEEVSNQNSDWKGTPIYLRRLVNGAVEIDGQAYNIVSTTKAVSRDDEKHIRYFCSSIERVKQALGIGWIVSHYSPK